MLSKIWNLRGGIASKTLLLLLAACFALWATLPSVFADSGADNGKNTAAAVDNTETGIGVMIQEYSGSSTAEILMIQYNGQQKAFENYNWKNPEIEAINTQIKSGPLQIYHDYHSGRIKHVNSIDIFSYPFVDDEFVQIVTSCVVYPETRSDLYTKLWSYNFSKTENKFIDTDSMLKKHGLTRNDIAEKLKELYKSAYDNQKVLKVDVTGFLIDRTQAKPVTHFLIEGVFEAKSDPYKFFFMYTPDKNELKTMKPSLLFDPRVYDMAAMNPPLAYESQVLASRRVTIDAADFEELSPNCKYMLDALLYVKLQSFPPLAQEMYNEATILSRIKELAGNNIRVITVTQSEKDSALLTYPTWRIVYEKGTNEDTSLCTDLYFQTDSGEYRVHTTVPVDYAQEYRDRIEQIFASVSFAETDE